MGALAHKLKSSARSVGALTLGELCAEIKQAGPGSRYFCESFYGHPYPTSGKNYAFGKPAFSLRKNTLRENTCPIASGDYSTPVSQRRLARSRY